LITTSQKISDGYKRTLLKKGDLVMALRGKIGQIAKIDDELVGANLTRGVALIALKGDYCSDFVLQQISSDRTIKVFERSLNGSALQELSIGIVRKIPIILPKSLTEQQSIARILKSCDEVIETTEKLIAQKELRRKWLMQHLLTGKKRIKGFNEKWVTLKMKEIGIIPEKKAIVKVDNLKLLTVKLHTKGIEFNERDKPIISSTGRPYYERNKGEILIGRQNIHNGGIGLITDEFDGHICSNAISSFIVNSTFSLNFILFYLQYPANYQRIEDYMGGTGQKELSEKQLLETQIKLPKSNEEQTAIAQVLHAADKEISLLKLKAEKLREKKKGLMQQLLTGKTRIK
jgi:type I restriction enzyme S subunit